MKTLVLKVVNENWGIDDFSWERTEWKIYDNYMVKAKIFYRANDAPKEVVYKITPNIYEKIIKYIESAKKIDMGIVACDGEAWEFTQFERGKKIWKRELGYIYGIWSLENIAKILERLESGKL